MSFMDNKKITYPLSIFSVLYLLFIGWMCSLCYAYYFDYQSMKVAYLVYFLINIAFAVPIIITRKTVTTIISMILLFAVNLALVIMSIETGMWLLFIPSVLVNLAGFFSLKLRYTTKALLTTLSAVMYVLGICGYFLYGFLFGKFPFHNFSESIRYSDETSPSGNYRYVIYLKEHKDKNKTDVNIYVEPCAYDKHFGFVTMKKYYDDMKIYTGKDVLPKEIIWESDTEITIKTLDDKVETKVIDIKE